MTYKILDGEITFEVFISGISSADWLLAMSKLMLNYLTVFVCFVFYLVVDLFQVCFGRKVLGRRIILTKTVVRRFDVVNLRRYVWTGLILFIVVVFSD